MVGASLQTAQTVAEQEGAAIESTTTESGKNSDEMVGAVQEASTENIQQAQDEVTTQSSIIKLQNDDDEGMVGMALPSATEATVEQNDATQAPTEPETQADEKVSAPIETPKDDSQVTVDEKVEQYMVECERKMNETDFHFFFAGNK